MGIKPCSRPLSLVAAAEAATAAAAAAAVVVAAAAAVAAQSHWPMLSDQTGWDLEPSQL